MELEADPAAAEEDGIIRGGGLVDGCGEGLLHAYGATASVDIACKGQELLLGKHGNGLFSYGLGGFLEIQLLGNGDHKDIVGSAFPCGNQGLEDSCRILSHVGGNICATDNTLIGVERVGELLAVELSDGIGLFHRDQPF